MSEFLYAVLQAAREIIPLLAMREEHLLQAGAKGAGGDISIGADLLCEAIFTKHLSHIGHIDSEESGFITAGLQVDKKVDSRFAYSAAAECMDCHATANALARNDEKTAKSVEKSHDEEANAKNVSEPAKDSRIVDEKSGLFKDSQGRALGVRNRRESAEIADLSLQAESTSKKPTPSPSDSKIVESKAQNVLCSQAVRRQDCENLESTFDTAPILNNSAQDSRICDEKSGLFKDSQGRALGVRNRRESVEIADLSRKAESTSKKPTPSPSDSKIVELESGLFKPRVGDKTDGLSSSRGDEIHDSSPQAESPKQNKDSRAAPTIVLDPLDGSDNYLSNIPYYGASLALCDSTGAVLEAAVINYCSAYIIYGNRHTPNATRIHIFTQEQASLAPTRAKCGVFEKAYSYPDIARELYAHKLKFRSLGASALSLAYALEHNYFLFCGAIRKYDALAGLFLCRNLHIARGADFLLVSQNKQVFGMIEQILSKHHIKQI